MEAEPRSCRCNIFVQIKKAGDLSTDLDAVPPVNLRQYVRKGVSPLIEYPRPRRPKRLNTRRRRCSGRIPDVIDRSRWQPERLLRIARYFIPAPPRRIHTR